MLWELLQPTHLHMLHKTQTKQNINKYENISSFFQLPLLPSDKYSQFVIHIPTISSIICLSPTYYLPTKIYVYIFKL